MDSIEFVTGPPRPSFPTPDAALPGPYRDSLPVVRMKATLAVERVDALLRGAAARTLSGTWEPAAARNTDDYSALARCDDIIRARRTTGMR
jgi:hypothetical protein